MRVNPKCTENLQLFYYLNAPNELVLIHFWFSMQSASMTFLRVFLFVSIFAPAIIQAHNIQQFNGKPERLWCGPNELIEIIKTEIVKKENLGSIQKRIFETLPKEMTQTIKEKCQYKEKCDINEPIGINNKVYLDIEFKCNKNGCPNSTFLKKHIARFTNDPTDAELEIAARNFEVQRGKRDWQRTDLMDFYADPKEFMEYEKRGNTCVFKTAAQKYRCQKHTNKWHCSRSGTAKAVHDTGSGHYMGETN